MPKLIIKRNSEWANKMRSFHIYLNGRKLTEIKDKEVKAFDLPQGEYQLIAKIDWCGSQPLDFKISKDEVKRIEVHGFILSKYFLPTALFCGLLYFAIYFKYHRSNLFLGFMLMLFLGYLLYFLSFGRNQYLRLKEF